MISNHIFIETRILLNFFDISQGWHETIEWSLMWYLDLKFSIEYSLIEVQDGQCWEQGSQMMIVIRLGNYLNYTFSLND